MEPRGAEPQGTASRVFTFEDPQRSRPESACVSIPEVWWYPLWGGVYSGCTLAACLRVTKLRRSQFEVLDPQYGMYVWPCAVVLAQFVWMRREELRDRTVLELGAGVSLPGVLAATCGAKVILTDSAETPSCLENCRRSCDANSLHQVTVVGITWGEVSPELVLLPELDVILASDVFYDPQDFEDVLLTVVFLLRRNPQAQFWTTYQDRSADWSMEALLRQWRLRCVNVCLDSFGADKPSVGGSSLPGHHSIHMMVITVETEDGGV